MNRAVRKDRVADQASREHLVRLLVEQVERTFSHEGSSKAFHELGICSAGSTKPPCERWFTAKVWQTKTR